MIGGAALLLAPLGVILFSAGSNRGGKPSIPPVLGTPGPGPTAPAGERPVAPPPIREPLDQDNPPGRVVACRGDWEIVGDSLCQSSLARGYGLHPLLIFGDPDWSEYDLTLEAKKEGGAEGFRIQFHWQDQVTFDSFGLGIYGNKMHMFRDMHDGTFMRANDKRIEDNPIQADRWYSLKIQVRGKSCRCFLDDELLFEDANFRFDHGRIGLATWETSARFRNIRVATPSGRTLFEGFPSVSDLSGDPRLGAGSPQDRLRRGNTDKQLKILSNVAGARVGAKRLAELFHGTLRDDEVLSLDLFYSRNDVLFTHPLAQDEPAIIDFSKLTEASEGRLFLFCKSFPAIGYNAKVVIRKAGKFCMDRTIIGDKDREWDVIIVPFSHESLVLEHHAANRDHELLITDYLILDK